MRIFKDFIEADKEVERELFHNGLIYQTQTWQNKDVSGDDNFKTKELLGYTFMVKDPNILEYIKFKGLNSNWIGQEFLERISKGKVNPGEAWKEREDVWNQFLVDGKFDYSYSERIGSQVEDVINLLKEIPASRHGIISIYDPAIDGKRRDGKHRVPCSIYYLLTIREGKVQMLYNIRSNDFITHFPYDITLARMLQDFVAKMLGLPAGDFIYQSGSLHAFKKDNNEIF